MTTSKEVQYLLQSYFKDYFNTTSKVTSIQLQWNFEVLQLMFKFKIGFIWNLVIFSTENQLTERIKNKKARGCQKSSCFYIHYPTLLNPIKNQSVC